MTADAAKNVKRYTAFPAVDKIAVDGRLDEDTWLLKDASSRAAGCVSEVGFPFITLSTARVNLKEKNA